LYQRTLIAFAAALALAGVVRADEILFKNGDRLTGTVKSADGGKIKFKSDLAGDITVDMKDVQTFTTTAPVQIKLQDNSRVNTAVSTKEEIPKPTTQPTGQVVLNGKEVPTTDIKKIIPPSKWTGSIVANGDIQRGNTHSTDFGLAVDASLRRDDENHDDRFGLSGAYNFGNETTNGVQSTSTDNWFAQAKYDKFLSEKLYAYGIFRADHDRLAQLNYRLSPGAGIGYQWIESAAFNFSTEVGGNWIIEDYDTSGQDQKFAIRLAYHIDKKLSDKVSVFHNLEWLPAIDDPSDYILNVDAGIKAMMTTNWFSQLKVTWQRDSTPAPGSLKDDTRFLIGIGWQF
jgi:putative salt-induced outer membrane protein YdiY